jgi:hypothetical protein
MARMFGSPPGATLSGRQSRNMVLTNPLVRVSQGRSGACVLDRLVASNGIGEACTDYFLGLTPGYRPTVHQLNAENCRFGNCVALPSTIVEGRVRHEPSYAFQARTATRRPWSGSQSACELARLGDRRRNAVVTRPEDRSRAASYCISRECNGEAGTSPGCCCKTRHRQRRSDAPRAY